MKTLSPTKLIRNSTPFFKQVQQWYMALLSNKFWHYTDGNVTILLKSCGWWSFQIFLCQNIMSLFYIIYAKKLVLTSRYVSFILGCNQAANEQQGRGFSKTNWGKISRRKNILIQLVHVHTSCFLINQKVRIHP